MKTSMPLNYRRWITGVVWLIGLAIAVTAIARRPASQIRAVAWAPTVTLAAPDDGTLIELAVSLHQTVVSGERIARFDATKLTARRQVLAAELEAMSQKEDSAQKGRSRVFERDREAASLELAKLEANIEEDLARDRTLRQKLEVDQKLAAQGLLPIEKANDIRRQLEVVEARLTSHRDRLSLAQQRASQTRIRAETASDSSRWQTLAASRRLGELEERLQRLNLHSTAAGQVTEIYRAAGEWLPSGEPVLRISPTSATEVHAWLDSPSMPQLQPGTPAVVTRSNGERLEGSVASVGVERLQLPEILWLRADYPEWGYQIRVIIGGALAPGETVQVSLKTESGLSNIAL